MEPVLNTPKRLPRAKANSLMNSGHYFPVKDHRCAAGLTIEDILKHGYWIDVAHSLDVGTEVKVISEDFTFFARVLVEQFQHNVGAKVFLLEYQDLTQAQKTEGELPNNVHGHEVKWRGARKWSIVNAQGAVIKEDMNSRQEAEKELLMYSKALAA